MALKTITVILSNGMRVTLPIDENLKEKVAKMEAEIKSSSKSEAELPSEEEMLKEYTDYLKTHRKK